uniref:Uncharacterized protein n=1 Tax=Tolypothrix bouteillei VB521301 TaxID=1479485 RepID=A0A0C1QXZ5_9CYAN
MFGMSQSLSKKQLFHQTQNIKYFSQTYRTTTKNYGCVVQFICLLKSQFFARFLNCFLDFI